MDLSRICGSLRNYFVRADKDIKADTYTISGGILTPSDFLQPGQYFRIVGSIFNDGVYKYGDATDIERLTDEIFEGAVWAMRVPRSFIDLVADYDRLNAKVEELALVAEGFASESFDGYAYTLLSSAPAELVEWQNRLESELNQYRRISVL